VDRLTGSSKGTKLLFHVVKATINQPALPLKSEDVRFVFVNNSKADLQFGQKEIEKEQ